MQNGGELTQIFSHMSAKDAGILASNADVIGYTVRKVELKPGMERYYDIELKIPYSEESRSESDSESRTWCVSERVSKIFALLQVP